jgi:hypothetical protein
VSEPLDEVPLLFEDEDDELDPFFESCRQGARHQRFDKTVERVARIRAFVQECEPGIGPGDPQHSLRYCLSSLHAVLSRPFALIQNAEKWFSHSQTERVQLEDDIYGQIIDAQGISKPKWMIETDHCCDASGDQHCCDACGDVDSLDEQWECSLSARRLRLIWPAFPRKFQKRRLPRGASLAPEKQSGFLRESVLPASPSRWYRIHVHLRLRGANVRLQYAHAKVSSLSSAPPATWFLRPHRSVWSQQDAA